jgi:hypothetical protein
MKALKLRVEKSFNTSRAKKLEGASRKSDGECVDRCGLRPRGASVPGMAPRFGDVLRRVSVWCINPRKERQLLSWHGHVKSNSLTVGFSTGFSRRIVNKYTTYCQNRKSKQPPSKAYPKRRSRGSAGEP